MDWITSNVSWMVGIVQIAFFVVIGWITVLTYRHARRTILQPIKTETYKAQLNVLGGVADLVSGQSESDLRNRFGFHHLLRINAIKLLDDFAEDHSDKRIDRQTREYSIPGIECKINLRAPIAAEWVLLRDAGAATAAASTPPTKQPKRDWQNYIWEEIYIPRALTDARQKLTELLRSPLMPDVITAAILELEQLLERNVEQLQLTIQELGRELEATLRRDGRVSGSSWEWMQNRYNERFLDLLPAAQRISETVKSYCRTNEIMD